MKFRRLDSRFQFSPEFDVKDPLKEAMDELPDEQTLAVAYIKPPDDGLFILATLVMEPEEDAPSTVADMFEQAKTDVELRKQLQAFAFNVLEALNLQVPVAPPKLHS